MNQTLHNLTLTGRITFADGSIFDSASANNFANVSGFSRNMIDGTTSLLQDRLLLHQDVACATSIQCPQLSLQVLQFTNDLDSEGIPVLQTKGFSDELRAALLLAQAGTSFLSSIFTQNPISLGWSENDVTVNLDYTGISFAGVTNTHQSHLTNTELHIIDTSTSDEMFLDHNGLVLLQASTQHQIEFTPTILDFQNAENIVSIGHSTYQNNKVGVEVYDLLSGMHCNLEPDGLIYFKDSGNNSILSSSQIQFTNDSSQHSVLGTYLQVYNDANQQSTVGATGFTTTEVSGTSNINPSSISVSNGVKTTTITATSITTGTLNYTSLNPAANVSAITATTTNASGSYNVLLQNATGTGSKTVYVDDVTGPLQYDPSLSQLSCGCVYSTSTSNTISLLTGPLSSQPFKGWTNDPDYFTSGVSISYNTLYLTAISVTALQPINGFTLYFTAGNSSGQLLMGLYSSPGYLVKTTSAITLPTSESKKDAALSSSYTPANSGVMWVGILVSNSVSVLGLTNKIISPTPIAGGGLNGRHATLALGSFSLPSPISSTVTNSGVNLWTGYW